MFHSGPLLGFFSLCLVWFDRGRHGLWPAGPFHLTHIGPARAINDFVYSRSLPKKEMKKQGWGMPHPCFARSCAGADCLPERAPGQSVRPA
ncbi:hypothetical protein B8V81_1730 [Paenibacillus pasadenensis]|uniref:Uncharacterized protein n=1 Tax=Paenibacillus pasadenensis TaxID=217090 RepID=A0A2N5NAY3_9BACL|nr:hypothetical protein B8V81_1730 [Paenibacillus pasadenensis]